jgi:hypothetical protein
MPKSRNRKQHKQKLAVRNEKIKAQQKKIQKEYTKMFETQMELLRSKFSGETEDGLNVSVDGNEIPFEVVKPNE